MDGKFCSGDRIVIKLNSGEHFEGDFVRTICDVISIDNMLHYETGNKIESVYDFHKREIDRVYKLRIERTRELVEDAENTKSTNTDSILMPREEYDRLKDMANNYIYIKTDDKTYFDAVNEISNFESIGVLGIQRIKGRSGNLILIAISTWKQVYIFDLKNFRTKKFPTEIAEILESTYIKKIVHNGGIIVDCLQHCHEIIMKNIFDTQVSHLLISKNSKGTCPEELKNIGECLTEYFNFPSTLLTSAMLSLNETWDGRPLLEEQLKKLSKLVTYLPTIKDHQLSLMLKDFDKAVCDYHCLFTKSTEFQLIKRSSTVKCSKDIDVIIPFSLLSFQGKN